MVAEIFTDSHETYDYRRVHAALLRRGEHCSAELVRALMRELGLVPAQVRAFRPVTTVQGDFRGIPDLVRRDFTAQRPGLKLVCDITYIPTWEGFLYLATVIDCHSKAVLGWAMADHYRTDLIKDAIRMAADRSSPQSRQTTLWRGSAIAEVGDVIVPRAQSSPARQAVRVMLDVMALRLAAAVHATRLPSGRSSRRKRDQSSPIASPGVPRPSRRVTGNVPGG